MQPLHPISEGIESPIEMIDRVCFDFRLELQYRKIKNINYNPFKHVVIYTC